MCNQLFVMTKITLDFVHVLIACLINSCCRHPSIILLLSVYIPRYLPVNDVLYIIDKQTTQIIVYPRVIIIGILWFRDFIW